MSRDFWLLAHPDDEIFGIPLWFNQNNESTFYFLVTHPAIRVRESLKLEEYLSTNRISVQIKFSMHNFVDGKISQCLTREALLDIMSLINTIKPNRILTLAFEGGHQDHDYVNELTRLIASELKLEFVEVPAYQNARFGFGFQVMKVRQVSHITLRISLQTLIIAIRVALIYKSQWKTWLGLLPGILSRYSKLRYKYIVNVDRSEILYYNKSLYERRRRADSRKEKEAINVLRSTFKELLDSL